MRRGWAYLAAVVALCAVTPAAEASVAVPVRGRAVCTDGQPISGVALVHDGGTEPAALTIGTANHVGYYTATLSSDRFPIAVEVHVGCGGADNRAPRRGLSEWSLEPTSTTTVLNVRCEGGGCSFASASTPSERIDHNPYEPYKYSCTYGAAEKFVRATQGSAAANSVGASSTGIFMRSVMGDAHRWDELAAFSGWEVSSLHPVARSVVVFERGVHGADGVRGHVGWVTNVTRSGAGYDVTFLEMNVDGSASDPSYHERTVPHVGGMSYVLAPAPGAG